MKNYKTPTLKVEPLSPTILSLTYSSWPQSVKSIIAIIMKYVHPSLKMTLRFVVIHNECLLHAKTSQTI